MNVVVRDDIFNDSVALYQAGNQSAKPWASIAVGDYLQWVKSGTAPFRYKTFAPADETWKLKTPKKIMSRSADTIKELRDGVPDAEKKELKKERLTFSHCNPAVNLVLF